MGTGEAFNKPEGTSGEASFASLQAIYGRADVVVTIDEAVLGEVRLNSLQGREPSVIGGADETHERHEQNGRVEGVGTFVLDKGLEIVAPEIREDVFIDG